MEEVLLHYPGKILDVGAHMPGFKIMLQNKEGLYGNATHTLKLEGHMLIYNPQKDSTQWVPKWGISESLTSSKLSSANDLHNMNPRPSDWPGFMIPQSPMLVQGVPTGAEVSDSDSCGGLSDLGEEWDSAEVGDWSCCPDPPCGKVPPWAEAHAEVQRKVVIDKDTPTWEEVVSGPLQRKEPEKEDSDWDEDTHEPVKSQFEDAMVVAETCMDTAEESAADAPQPEDLVEASVGPSSQDMVQIHMGNDNLD